MLVRAGGVIIIIIIIYFNIVVIIIIKRDHCTALRAVQDPSMTLTCLLGVWGVSN